MTELIGASHQRILQSISAMASRAREQGNVSAVMLVGGPGVGKTRLVQELYASLVKMYDQHGYWSPSIRGNEGRSGDNCIVPNRNDGVASKRRGFSWVAMRCVPRVGGAGGLDSGVASDAARLARRLHGNERLTSLRNHALLVIVSASALQGIVSVIGIAGVSWVAPTVAVVGFGAVIWDSAEVIRSVRENRRRARRRHTKSSYSADDDPGDVIQLAVKGTPLNVVVVDDAQYADETVLETIQHLAEIGVPSMFVFSMIHGMESDALREQPLDRWIEEHVGDVMVLDVLPLTSTDIVDLVCSMAPELAPDEAETIARYSRGNPRAALTVLGLRTIQQLLRNQERMINDLAREIDRLPPEADELINVEWSHFPATVKRLLVVASLVGRTVPTSDLKDVFEKYVEGDVDALLKSARMPYRWLEEVDALVDRFSQESLYRFAASRVNTELLLSEIEDLKKEVVQALGTLTKESADDSSAITGALYLGAEQLLSGPKVASVAAARATGRAVRLLSRPSQAQTRLDYCDALLQWCDSNDDAGEDAGRLRVMGLYYRCKALDVLDPQEARKCRDLLTEVISPHDGLYGDHMLRVANGLLRSGRYGEAETLYTDLLNEASGNGDSSVAISALGNLAVVASRRGDIARAFALSKKANKSTRRLLGVGTDWMTGRSNMAIYSVRLGRHRRGRRIIKRALRTGIRTLGMSHPSCVRMRSVEMWVTSQDLGPETRLNRLAEYLAVARPVLGDHDTVILDCLRDQVLVLIELNRLDEAQRMARDLIAQIRLGHGEGSRVFREVDDLLRMLSDSNI